MSLDDEGGRWKRNRFAEDLEHALANGMVATKEYFKNVEVLIVPAFAKGNNAKTVHQFMKPDSEIVGIDPTVAPDFKLFGNIKFTPIKGTFEEADLSPWDGKNKAVKVGNYLQLYPYPDKATILKKMKEIVGPKGKVIIIDEVFADSFVSRLWDLILNKGYNFMVPGPYIRLSLADYHKLFEECGLEIKFEGNYNRRTFLWMLEVK